MVHGIYFRDGEASYRNRYVQTDALMSEAGQGFSDSAGVDYGQEVSLQIDVPLKQVDELLRELKDRTAARLVARELDSG